jgi:hypothetical protein
MMRILKKLAELTAPGSGPAFALPTPQDRDEVWATRQQAKLAATAEIERKPRTLDLALCDFTLIETFRGFYEFGWRDHEVESRHQVNINAKWRHVARSEKIYLAGDAIDPETTLFWISAASRKDATDKSHASHYGLTVYLIEDVFSALVDTVARGDIKGAEMQLQTEPWDGTRHRLVFGSLRITSHRRESLADPVHVPLPRELKRLLYVIIWLLGGILLCFFR